MNTLINEIAKLHIAEIEHHLATAILCNKMRLILIERRDQLEEAIYGDAEMPDFVYGF